MLVYECKTYRNILRNKKNVCQYNTANLVGYMEETEERAENFRYLRLRANVIKCTGDSQDNLTVFRYGYMD